MVCSFPPQFLKSYSFHLPYIVLLTFLYLISHLYFSKFLFGFGTGYWDGLDWAVWEESGKSGDL